ncbi:MAG: hypothetical protein GXO48_02600 [Chlorobi bacterium]|nr:hypothetical protein [Chlorobiota bacterium]
MNLFFKQRTEVLGIILQIIHKPYSNSEAGHHKKAKKKVGNNLFANILQI